MKPGLLLPHYDMRYEVLMIRSGSQFMIPFVVMADGRHGDGYQSSTYKGKPHILVLSPGLESSLRCGVGYRPK